MKQILELSHTKAFDFLLQGACYSTITLPIYFDFSNILDFVKTKIGSKDFSVCLKDKNVFPSDFDNVNYGSSDISSDS